MKKVDLSKVQVDFDMTATVFVDMEDEIQDLYEDWVNEDSLREEWDDDFDAYVTNAAYEKGMDEFDDWSNVDVDIV
jgi:hypothetical protein